MIEIIDKDSPNNLSKKDALIYEQWLCKGKYIPPPWYGSIYCKTDHTARIRAECAIRYKGKCQLSSKHYKIPMHIHHRDYKSLWQERWCDIVYICQDCHERYHEIWPEINCKFGNYLAKLILHETKELLGDDKELQAIFLDSDENRDGYEEMATKEERDKYLDKFNPLETIKPLVVDSVGTNGGKRAEARREILEKVSGILHYMLGHYGDTEKTHQMGMKVLRKYYVSQMQKVELGMCCAFLGMGISVEITKKAFRHYAKDRPLLEIEEIEDVLGLGQ